MSRPIPASHDSVWRLKMALNDLERATADRNLPAARYLLDTEVMEAMSALRRARIVDDDLLDHLMTAVLTVQDELWRNPRSWPTAR